MPRRPWLRTEKVRELERRLGEPLRDYLLRAFFDEALTVGEVRSDIMQKGGDISRRMLYHYLEQLKTELRRES